jgi:hypothetical protein
MKSNKASRNTVKSNKVNKQFHIVDHIIVDSNGDYKQDTTGLSDYVEIKYVFEKQYVLFVRSFWEMIGISLIIGVLMLLLVIIFPIILALISVFSIPMLVLIIIQRYVKYKVNFFEVKVYKNSQLVKELDAHDCQSMYFRCMNIEEIYSYESFIECIVYYRYS